jgi:predicted hydrolase (HD superfamily)
MAATGHTRALDANIACPACGYLLRGLRGLDITCPECGRECDVIEAASLRRSDWSSCPPYARMQALAICFYIIVVPVTVSVMAAIMTGTAASPAPMAVALSAMVATGGWWLWSFSRAAGALPGQRGVWALLLLHALIPAYIAAAACAMLAVTLLLVLIFAAMRSQWWAVAGQSALFAVAAGGLMCGWLAYRADQWIGRACLRHHLGLRRASEGGSPPRGYDAHMTIDEARQLMHEWVKSDALRGHIECVAACMAAYAERLEPNPQKRENWVVGGLLHDFDYERHPTREEHPFIGVAHLRARGDVDQEIITAILGHADYSGVARMSPMAKALYAVDELAGFIVACAKVRPQGIADLEPKSVKKKLKDKAFAAAVSREDIRRGIEELGVDETEHIQMCIEAIRTERERLGL